MTYKEFQRLVGKAGLKLGEFARLMKMHPTSITNKGTKGVPWHLAVIAALFAEMADRGIDFRAILLKIDSSSIASDPTDTDGITQHDQSDAHKKN